ncbi:hypothetical protein [Ascidiaceihabitans donghaensis]|nr:hypothetical protein [Ascidiaceihabitans donghaensis]
MKRLLTSIPLIAFVTSNAVSAQGIDGLYQPTGLMWSCSPDQIGMDGGALAIQNGVLDGVENRCDLTNPTPMDSSIRFTAVCSAEGSTYSERMTITPTSTGVRIERNGFTSSWSRCEGHQAATGPTPPRNDRWTFGGGQGVYESATRDNQGNSITFTCNDLGENGGLYVELGGQPISGGQVSFDVDGATFGMTAWAEGGRINTECTVCGGIYTSLWNATAAGNLMTVTASDGRTAVFSLAGSGDALGNVACQPDDGF